MFIAFRQPVPEEKIIKTEIINLRLNPGGGAMRLADLRSAESSKGKKI
jgi:hypothetical protein